MAARKLLIVLTFATITLPLHARAGGSIEPNAGQWRTWVISSGADYRVPPPPGSADTQAELRALADLVSHNDAQIQQQIAFWDAGAPAYRWIDLINERALAGVPTTTNISRVYAYVGLAMYDATIAAWESKYFYNRKRPSERDHRLPTALPVPQSPSYPSEHAAAAQAAASVLAYFLPAEAQAFQRLAEEAGWSRVLAGLQYPSDYDAGLALGRKVAEQVIAKAQADGWNPVFTGTVPTGPCLWIGSNPANFGGANDEAVVAELAQSIQARGSAGLRLPTSRCGNGARSQLPARRSGQSRDIRHQLQSVLLAKPGRPVGLALPLRR